MVLIGTTAGCGASTHPPHPVAPSGPKSVAPHPRKPPQRADANRYLPNRVAVLGHGVYESFLTPTLAWKLTGLGLTGKARAAVQIYQSTNGGASWRLVSSTHYVRAAGKVPLFGFKDGLSFLTATKGWLAAGDWGVSQPVQPLLYETRNAGRSWTRQPLPMPVARQNTAFYLTPPAFFSPRDGVMMGYFGRKIGPIGMLWATTDGGRLWRAEPMQAGRAGSVRWSFPSNRVMKVIAFGGIWETNNDGYTWAKV